MATQRETIENLIRKDEVLYWARINGLEVEEFPGGLHVDGWTVTFTNEENIAAVVERLDVPREL